MGQTQVLLATGEKSHETQDITALHTPVPVHRVVEWHYGVDGETYADSSTYTYSTMAGSGSPRSIVGVRNTRPVVNSDGGLMNPLEQFSDSYDSDHLYQTLDPVHHHEGDMLEVMLPGGEVVAATLVRKATGKMIPLVISK